MGQVRDPAFWKRFSTAVHLNDVESTAGSPSPSSTFSSNSSHTLSKRPQLNHQNSWLARQERKKKKRTWICWAFWLGLLTFGAVVVVVVVVILKSGVLEKLGKKLDGQDS